MAIPSSEICHDSIRDWCARRTLRNMVSGAIEKRGSWIFVFIVHCSLLGVRGSYLVARIPFSFRKSCACALMYFVPLALTAVRYILSLFEVGGSSGFVLANYARTRGSSGFVLANYARTRGSSGFVLANYAGTRISSAAGGSMDFLFDRRSKAQIYFHI